MSLDVLLPEGGVLHADASAVRAVDATGGFGLLPEHEDFCAALVPSVLTYREMDGREHYVAVDGGVLVLEHGRVSVATRDAVLADDLNDVSKAVTSMLRGRRGQELEAAQIFRRLVAELMEQLPQLGDRR